ncbi:unnamed protein product [Prorocentrum cordatum]|uniref:4Fe-4S ferredoxin-type domain-containing protein n=1 Tax=Prorocentrum cordatum TaxID=2364126 RepID=A0ABN9WFL3_9DINO|nr:unnamed protein product [Polarella glacialis]
MVEGQVAALGGSEVLGRALAGGTPLGKDLGTPDEEEFASQAMAWAIRFADAPEFSVDGGDSSLCTAVEWLLGQHASDPGFSTVVGGNPRSPKKVLAAAARDAMSMELRRLQTSGQRFLRNPQGVKPFLKRGVMAAFGSPFDADRPEWLEKLRALGLTQDLPSASEERVPNSWHGDEYEPSDKEKAFLADEKNLRKATVRIEEIMSFEYMQHVGNAMLNCLRVERTSQLLLAVVFPSLVSLFVQRANTPSAGPEREAVLQRPEGAGLPRAAALARRLPRGAMATAGMAAPGAPAALGPEAARPDANGAAVARMREQQRRMRLTREGPLNPDTKDYCGAFVSLDEDNSWDYPGPAAPVTPGAAVCFGRGGVFLASSPCGADLETSDQQQCQHVLPASECRVVLVSCERPIEKHLITEMILADDLSAFGVRRSPSFAARAPPTGPADAAFKRGFSIRVTSLSDEAVEFDMVGIDPPLANAFRRLLLGEVPTVAISEVTVYQNTGVLHDENLVHRLGLCPIRCEPDRLEAKLPDMEFNETNSLKFRLHTVCGDKPRRVLSKDLTWVPWSPAQKQLFVDGAPAPVADDVLITQLRPGQEIELECFCAKGTGREHAKWSPVSTASYRLLPYADLSRPILDGDAERLKATCGAGVFDIEELPGGGKRAVVANPRSCVTCRECLESFPGEAMGLEIGKIKDHYLPACSPWRAPAASPRPCSSRRQ